MAKDDVWCVAWETYGHVTAGRYVYGALAWCATATRKAHQEGKTFVETLCNRQVAVPRGSEERIPTCAMCRAALMKEQADGEG